MKLRSGIAMAALLLAYPAVASDEEPASVPEPGVYVGRLDPLTWMRAVVPGKVVAYALPRSGDTRQVVVLVGDPGPEPGEPTVPPDRDGDDDEDADRGTDERLPPCPTEEHGGAMALYRAVSTEPPVLEPVAEGLPADCSALDAADLDGDGRDELLIGRPGEILVVRQGKPETLLDEPSLAWRSLHPVAVRHRDLDGEPYVVSAGLGGLQLHGPVPESESAWGRLAAVDVPMQGEFRGSDIRVGNPVPSFVGRRDGGELVFATWPEVFDAQRLRILSVAMTPSGGSEVVECWARMAGREEILDRHFLWIDGGPVLLVTTKPADELNLFGEKRLYLFPLESDRSRLGRPPLWQVRTRMNIWQEAHPKRIDVNGDGRPDLVVGYWKGILGDPKVVLDAYLRREDGWFETGPRSTAFEVDGGDRSMVLYGDDVTGDGLADLIVRGDDGISIHPGLASDDGKKLVRKRPLELGDVSPTEDAGEAGVVIGGEGGVSAWSAEGARRPRLADLDGDGKMEILVLVRGARDELWVLDVRAAS